MCYFNWGKSKKYKFKCANIADFSYKIPLFRRKRGADEIYYSYVDWTLVKNERVGLTIENFTPWLNTEPLILDDLFDWMDQERVLLRFYRKQEDVTDRQKRYLHKRTNCPGDYEPEWRPKMQFYIFITEYPFETFELSTEKPIVELKCGMPDCGFRTPRRDKLEKHRKTCRNYTLVTSKQRMYGNKQELIEPVFKFACFDIETIEKPSEFAEATLELLSIGCATNVSGLESKYFVRDSSSAIDGQAIVDQFMDYLFQLNNSYESCLPAELYDEYEEVSEVANFWGQTRNKTKKAAAHLKKMAIKEQLMFSVYGFNSRKFDVKVLIGYMIVYAKARNLEINLLKKGSMYFQLDIETLAFKGLFRSWSV